MDKDFLYRLLIYISAFGVSDNVLDHFKVSTVKKNNTLSNTFLRYIYAFKTIPLIRSIKVLPKSKSNNISISNIPYTLDMIQKNGLTVKYKNSSSNVVVGECRK